MSLVALEAALAASPDDPLVLAAYADCLADAGDPRGEFVRLQLALDDPATPNRRAIERELRRLWRLHAPDWQALPHGRIGYYRMDGACPLARFRSLSLFNAEVLAASPARWLVRGVWVDEVGDRDAVAPFVGMLTQTRVRTLRVQSRQFGDDGVEALVGSGLLPRLAELHLPGCGVTDDGAAALAAHPHTPRLEVLDLDRNHLSPIGHGELTAVGVHVSDHQYFMPGGGDFDPPAFPHPD